MYSEKNNSVGAAAVAFCIGKAIIIKDNIVIVEKILNKDLLILFSWGELVEYMPAGRNGPDCGEVRFSRTRGTSIKSIQCHQ
jgi:hypothetical protein